MGFNSGFKGLMCVKLLSFTWRPRVSGRPWLKVKVVPIFIKPHTMNTSACGSASTARHIIMFIFNYTLQPFKAYCAMWVRRSNFRHQASPRVSPRDSTQRRKVELWARNVREFCLNADFHVTFRNLLHAVKLRHGTDGFTSPPKEGVLRIFLPYKSDGFGQV